MSEIMLGVLRMPYDLFWADDPVLRMQHDAVRLEAADEVERLTATPCIPWRHHSEHGDTFEDGEQLMVAVPVRDNRTGKCHWDVECIVARVDDSDDTCSLESLYGDYWGWDWVDVEWWLPMAEVIGTLPLPVPLGYRRCEVGEQSRGIKGRECGGRSGR